VRRRASLKLNIVAQKISNELLLVILTKDSLITVLLQQTSVASNVALGQQNKHSHFFSSLKIVT